MQAHQKIALALAAVLVFASSHAFADPAANAFAKPPDGVVGFSKKDHSACPAGTKAYSGSEVPADALWCQSTLAPPTPPPVVAAPHAPTDSAVAATGSTSSSIVSHVGAQSATTNNSTIRSSVGVQEAKPNSNYKLVP